MNNLPRKSSMGKLILNVLKNTNPKNPETLISIKRITSNKPI